MQKRKAFQCSFFGRSTSSLRTHASSQGSAPESGSSKKRWSVMFEPRRKYGRPFRYARFVAVSKRNSRIPKRVARESPAGRGVEDVEERVLRRPQVGAVGP